MSTTSASRSTTTSDSSQSHSQSLAQTHQSNQSQSASQTQAVAHQPPTSDLQPPSQSEDVAESKSIPTKTTETISSAAATLTGALSGALSGGLNVGMKSKETSTTTRAKGDDEAGRRYEEAIEDEYAKREGGA